MINLIKLLLLLAVLVLGAGFAVLNEGQVVLNYYFGSVESPLTLALLGALGIGLMLGFIAGLIPWAASRRELANLRRRARLAQEEVNNLRSLPLKQH